MITLVRLHTCCKCRGPITEGDVYDYIIDGFPVYYHLDCPVVIEEVPVETHTPPFYKLVKIIFDFIGKEV